MALTEEQVNHLRELSRQHDVLSDGIADCDDALKELANPRNEHDFSIGEDGEGEDCQFYVSKALLENIRQLIYNHYVVKKNRLLTERASLTMPCNPSPSS